jgi:putative transposase
VQNLANATLREQSHIAKLRKKTPFWQSVGSQAVQDICQRPIESLSIIFQAQQIMC